MLNENKRHPCLTRKMLQEFRNCFQAAGRSSDADHPGRGVGIRRGSRLFKVSRSRIITHLPQSLIQPKLIGRKKTVIYKKRRHTTLAELKETIALLEEGLEEAHRSAHPVRKMEEG